MALSTGDQFPQPRQVRIVPCLNVSYGFGTRCGTWAKKILEELLRVCRRTRFAEGQFDVWAPDGLAALTIRHRRCMSWHHDVDACHGTMTYQVLRSSSAGSYSRICMAKYWSVHELLSCRTYIPLDDKLFINGSRMVHLFSIVYAL